MKYASLLIIIVLFCLGQSSSAANSDSLLKKIETYPERQQADSLKKIIIKNIFRDPKETFVYVSKFNTLPAVKRDSLYLCLGNYWMGMIYEMFGDYEKAIEYDFNSLEIAENINNRKLISITLNNIGLVYSNQKSYYDKALVYFKEYLRISEEVDNETDIMGAYMNIGMQFQRMGNSDSSTYYYHKAFDLANRLDSKHNIGLAYALLAENETHTGNKGLFLEYSRNAMKIYKDGGYLIDLAALYFDISKFFLINNNIDSALYYSSQMLNIANDYDLGNYKQNALKRISDIYFQNNTSDSAYYYLKEYIQLKDSISSQDTKEKLAQLQTIYEVKLKDKEIENFKITERLQSRKELFYLIIIIAMIIISISIIYSVILKRKKDRLVNQQKIVIHENEKELAKLALEKSKANEKELEIKLEFKTRQLTTHAISMMQKNKLMQELSESMSKVNRYVADDQKNEIRKLQRQIKRSLNVEKDWELFKMYFEQVNKDFFTRLLAKSPSLSSNDLRLSALIRLNMNIKEAASVFNVEPASVKSARYRLRKKLGLNQEDDLVEFMRNV